MLGVSNVSLRPESRRPATCSTACSCTSASRPGSTAAIVHAGKIMPLSRLPDEQREVCLDLVYDRRRSRTAPTTRCSGCSRCSPTCRRRPRTKEDRSGWPVDERLKHRIIDGDRDGLDRDLDEALAVGHAGAGDRQRRAARRHEGRRRAVRLGRDAAAVRAAVGRDHEDRPSPPRAAHGARRRSRRARAASCSPR